jgi:pimeloyl-ACP methyl ester carboxylesterase
MLDTAVLGSLCRSTFSTVILTSAIGMMLLPVGCGRHGNPEPNSTTAEEITDPSPSPQVPAPVLSIEAPPSPPPVLGGKDMSKENPAILRLLAFTYANKGSFSEAAQCQSWVVQRTEEGRYDLACWESLAGRTDVALYWLQEAGKHEGVNSRWAQQDPDLEGVRRDPRWPKLLAFLRRCESYWRAVGPKETVIITPSAYDGQAELSVVVWLHGMGGDPGNMKSVFQTLADRHRIGFIGVSGTIPTGKKKFAWADVAEDDYERIQLALKDADKRMHRRPGAVALGFSQGAMVGIEVAVRHPETFAGAISISAGTGSPVLNERTHRRFLDLCVRYRDGCSRGINAT